MSKGQKLLPELRFPDFKSNWSIKPLIKLADKKVKWSFTGGPFGSNLKASDYTDNGIRIIQLQNIGDGEFIDEYKIFTSSEKADELLSCNIYADEIILSKMGDPVGRACIIPENLKRSVMASDGIRLVVDENKYSKYFVFLLINSNPVRELIRKKSTGSTRKRIGLSDLKYINLPIPILLEEQKKIAACLSSLDQLIHAQQAKLKVLKDHKKGLLQNLFPQKGQNKPNYRFPEFEHNGDWQEHKLIDCLSRKPQYGINAPAVPYSKKLPKYIRITDISEDGVLLSANKVSVSHEVYEKDFLGIDDIVLARTGASVGKSYKYREIDGKLVFAGFLIRIKPSKHKLNSEFLFHFLFTNTYWKWVSFTSTRSGQPGINGTEYGNMPIKLPIDLTEQNKIASCLSAADQLITNQKQKIEQLKQHKKGLMQGLFPKMEF